MDFELLVFMSLVKLGQYWYSWNVYMKCRSWWVEQYWYLWVFHLRPSMVLKISVSLWILSNFKIEWSKLFQMKMWPLEKCRSWWVEQTLYSWVFYLKPSRARSKCVFVKHTILTLVKLGQMNHLSTSNGKLLNKKLLDIIKTYISYMDHIFIWINLI